MNKAPGQLKNLANNSVAGPAAQYCNIMFYFVLSDIFVLNYVYVFKFTILHLNLCYIRLFCPFSCKKLLPDSILNANSVFF